MTYEEKAVEDCIKELVKEMRIFRDKTHEELRIAKSKTNNFKFILMKFYQEAFKQGVYTAK